MREPAQRRSIDTRRRILRAATAAFSRDGFDASSVRVIAKSAGVRHQVIAYHFGTKTDLFRAVLDEGFETLRTLGRAFTFDHGSGRAADQFRVHLTTLLRFAADNPEIIRIIHMESLAHSERLADVVPKLNQFREFSRSYVAQLQRAGLARQVPLENLHMMFLAMVNQLALSPVVLPPDTPEETRAQLINEHADAIVRLFEGPK